MGYVGTVSAACLAQLGHEVIGVEPNLTKVEALNVGHSVIKEPGLDTLVGQMVGMGRLRATQDGMPLIPWADMSLICVGTPAAADGSPALEYVRNVAVDIGRGLREANDYHVVVLSCAFAVGALLGFLFGIPQYLAKQGGPSPDKASYQPNTNLTQVSEWLTKIIIGVGLVQFGQLVDAIGDLGDELESSFGGDPTGGPFAIASLSASS